MTWHTRNLIEITQNVQNDIKDTPIRVYTQGYADNITPASAIIRVT